MQHTVYKVLFTYFSIISIETIEIQKNTHSVVTAILPSSKQITSLKPLRALASDAQRIGN